MKKEHGIRELLKNRILRLQLFVLSFGWFTVTYVGSGILLSLGYLQGSIYINGYISGGAILAAQCLSGVLAEGMGRKGSLIFCLLLAGFACILYTPLRSLG